MFLLKSGDNCFINKLFNVYQSFLFLEFQNSPILCLLHVISWCAMIVDISL